MENHIFMGKNHYTWPFSIAMFNSYSSRQYIISGWWLTYPSEKYEFVSWDDDIPNIWEHKSHVPNHQTGIHFIWVN